MSEVPFYTTASGTSFSAPQTAGAIALMLEADPDLTPPDVKAILSRTATPAPKYFYSEEPDGEGVLNTYAAVLQAAFSDRKIGMFRSVLSQDEITSETSTPQTFTAPVYPGVPTSIDLSIPANTVEAGVSIGWNLDRERFWLAGVQRPTRWSASRTT